MLLRRWSLRLSQILLLFLLLLLGTTEVWAKKYSVKIDTNPAGAKIYLKNRSGKLLGKTPFRGKLSAGKHTIYIKKRGYAPTYQSIVVEKKRRAKQVFFFDLNKVSLGRIKIVRAPDSDRIRGARILIDGKEEGTAPDTIDSITVGPHQIEVIKDGYETFEAWIQVTANKTAIIEVELEEDPDASSGKRDDTEDDDTVDDDTEDDDTEDDDTEDDDTEDDDTEDDDTEDDDIEDDDTVDDDTVDDDTVDDDTEDDDTDSFGGDDEDGLEDKDGIKKNSQKSPRFSITVGPTGGFRSFKYQLNSKSGPAILPYSSAVIPAIQLKTAIFPLAGSDNPFLAGWGITGRWQAAASSEVEVQQKKLGTTWREWDANLNFIYHLNTIEFGISGGLGAQTFNFKLLGVKDTIIDQVPNVDYRFLQTSIIAGLNLGKLSSRLQLDIRKVSETGRIATKFAGSSVRGLAGSIGVNYSIFSSVQIQLGFNMARYTHIISVQNEEKLSNAEDLFLAGMLGIAYTR